MARQKKKIGVAESTSDDPGAIGIDGRSKLCCTWFIHVVAERLEMVLNVFRRRAKAAQRGVVYFDKDRRQAALQCFMRAAEHKRLGPLYVDLH